MTSRLLAQCVTVNGTQICGPAKTSSGQQISTLGDLVNTVLPFVYGLASIILLFVMIWGGYNFILSRGDPGKIKTARAMITAGIIGFVLLALAYFLSRLVSQIFNIGQGVFQ